MARRRLDLTAPEVTPGSAATFWVYVLECRDGSLYTGVAADVDARFRLHAAGKGARYTRARPPSRIVWREACRDRAEALKTEARFKSFSRRRKLLWLHERGAVPHPGPAPVRERTRTVAPRGGRDLR